MENSNPNMTKDEIMVQKMYPNEDLHGLSEKRICFSLNQLKFALYLNLQKKKRFLEFCEQMLIKNSFKSLDFYDVYRLISAVVGVGPIKTPDFLNNSIPNENIEFSVESLSNFSFQQKSDERENIYEKVNSLEKRLNDLEKRLKTLEKK